MENASKALIIAGAVLVSILLISVAILLVNQGNKVTSSSSQLSNSIEEKAGSKTNIIKTTLNSL